MPQSKLSKTKFITFLSTAWVAKIMRNFKFVYICSCMLLFASPVLAKGNISCKAPPKYVQLHYDFNWSISERKAIANSLELQCGEYENIDFLRQKIEKSIGPIGKVNFRANTHETKSSNNIEFDIVTEQFNLDKRASLFEIHHSVNESELIPYLNITGQPVEGEVLKANFAYDIDFILNHNAEMTVQWFRNGKPISGATKSSYEIKEEDVDKKIAIVAKIEKNQKVIAFKEIDFKKVIKLGPQLPTAKNINILGEPIIGAQLLLSYQYEDLNPGDTEGKSKIKWLRGEEIITGENGVAYTVTRKDKGHIISAEIEPSTIKGEMGKLSRISMNDKVVDPIEKASNAIDKLFPNNDLKTEFLSENIDKAQENKIEKILYRTKIEDRISISKDIKIEHNSPKQFVGFHANIFFKNHEQVIEQLEWEFLGKEISLENIEKLSQRAQSLASLSSSAKFSVSIPAQVIKNGIVNLDFSVIPSSQSPDRRGKSNKEENKYIQEFWLWGFVAHYLRLLL